MTTEKVAKVAVFFSCEKCNYECCKKSDYVKHCSTRKHKNTTFGDKIQQKSRQTITCSCGRLYNHRSSLFNHKKKCAINNKPEENSIIVATYTDDIEESSFMKSELTQLTSMVIELMKSNNELQKQMVEVCKTSSITNNNNINNINSHNKTFNLQFFLNEQCKDAMNLSDFANSFDLQLSDLESVGELGYVDGITKIIVDKLNSMDVYKRPIHCSDAKREIIYVKDENVWTKEEKDNPKLRQAIKNVSFRNMKLVYNWSNAYPESKDNESRLNDKYMKLVIESTGGKGPIMESENKIIRRIAKEIVIDKTQL